MIEHHIRPKVQPIFDYVGARAAHHNVCPNTITRIAFSAGALAACALVFGYAKLSLSLLIFSGLCDILDGTVARLTKKQSPFGAYMDLISDRMVEAMMIIGFTVAYPAHYFAYVLFLVAVLLHFSTFIVAGALFPNDGHKSIHYDRSIVERAEAFVIFAIMLIFPKIIFPLLMAFNLVIILSGYARYRRVKHYSKNYFNEHNNK